MRKFLLSALAILLAMGMIGSSFAYFSDSATSTGNTFRAGTLDLKMRVMGTLDFTDDCTATWVISDMEPGDDLGYRGFDFIYEGTLTPSRFQISCTNDDWLMAQQVLITYARYYDGPSNFVAIDVRGLLLAANGGNTWDGDGKVTLNDLALDASQDYPVLDSLPPPGKDLSETTHFELTLQFSDKADNDFQGDTLYATIIFTLHQ